MSQFDYIKDIAKHGLENDREALLVSLNELIEYSKNTKKLNFALQLQSILKDAMKGSKTSSLQKPSSTFQLHHNDDRAVNELILEKLTSDYSFGHLVCDEKIKENLKFFIEEHNSLVLLNKYELPVSNKILLHGPSGCGKTLASYVIAGELNKLMIVVNLGAIVSSKLGETSKNLAQIFRKAASEDCIIFIDEFDSLGKVRDYSQDHGEMKRVVNTILQLFDYLPQSSIVIAATNQVNVIDNALLRRFDLNVGFNLPTEAQIKDLVELTLKNGRFKFDKPKALPSILKGAIGFSYYTIQKSLITAIKRSIFGNPDNRNALYPTISTSIWKQLLLEEQKLQSNT